MSQRRGQGLVVLFRFVYGLMCGLLCLTFFMYSEQTGDRPRPLPEIGELECAIDITERKNAPAWDYDVSAVLFFYTYLLLFFFFFFFE